MSEEIKKLLKVSVGTTVIKKYQIFDKNLSTSFSLSSATWDLRDSPSGSVIKSGTGSVDNADTDRAGNTIKTVELTLDLDETDLISLGAHYLTILVTLTTGQSDLFRQPAEVVNYKTKGVS